MTNPKVDAYFDGATKWSAELQRLRQILLASPLEEDFKWRAPCYTYEGTNVLILGEYKDGCRAMFFEGVLLDDPDGLLHDVGERSRSQRALKYTDVDDIDEPALLGFIEQSIENHKAGRKVDLDEDRPELVLPDELVAAFDEVDGLRAAWDALTPGRQRGWVLHVSEAKQSATRAGRVEKAVPKILDGKGFYDR